MNTWKFQQKYTCLSIKLVIFTTVDIILHICKNKKFTSNGVWQMIMKTHIIFCSLARKQGLFNIQHWKIYHKCVEESMLVLYTTNHHKNFQNCGIPTSPFVTQIHIKYNSSLQKSHTINFLLLMLPKKQ